ncbi:hypothetical protein GRF59_15040 [Paenibacillus sp. HJL G12]|uniref:Uncharacterized protein n=1 Tax=Paenibacillus dendrobii TaxID=2691084 RepID=A0A7X3IK61_9BACL|nr:hypothetical protein [Paenibacillus dendrobii]MWV44936.1 hypothetical protein [Paenibacillus dendrobii]
MITRKDIEKLQSIVNQKACIAGTTNNNRTRAEFDEAIENLIAAEKAYSEQRKIKEVEYTISVRPIGTYNGKVTVWEDATNKEIEKAIFDDCEYCMIFDQN